MDITTLYPYTKDLHILYVEDEMDVVKQSIELFEMFFATVTMAKDGQKGLNVYKNALENNKYFDIVITDLNMPNMDGIKMIEEILTINPKQYISIISAQDESSKLLKLINLGIDSFLLKPLQKKQLLQTLYRISKNIKNEKISTRYHKNMLISNEQLEQEVKKRTQALKEQLYKDHLTGLKNRTALSLDFEKEKYNLLAIVDIALIYEENMA